ncbi:hypothetical protein COF67_25380 [Bacillus toyonensis]|uniref:hypothetical protein n=1 Tax=Bacillus toyonensis TaxID=155322 RepID=UPI000BFE4004|nr:hypothetical protein [Bacillus toyonensis]PHD44852.1 hypothetical protein COF67_25380 [Bacillus toyonensis]
MVKQQFVREEVYKSEKEDSRTISFVVNTYQDKVDKEKIWVVSKEILNPTEINNHENSVNYHPTMFKRLKEILFNEGRWID